MEVLDTVLIPVPAQQAAFFIEVRDRILSGDLSLGDLTGDVDASTMIVVPDQGRWSEEMLAKLEDRLTYPLVRRLLEICADRPGEWVSKSEIDDIGGTGPYQLRNELSAFSKLTRRLFGDVIWPIEWMKSDEGYLYRMPSGVAAVWGPLAGEPNEEPDPR